MGTRTVEMLFGNWTPDQADYNNPGALEAKNVVPLLRSYGGIGQLTSFSNALTTACLGTTWLQASDGTVYMFAGDTANLYRLTAGDTFTDVSGATYAATWWEFTKFGSLCIAASKDSGLHQFDVDADSAFSALGGSPPDAARIATIRDFVVIGDIDTLGPNWLKWCGFNNAELWTPSKATQSDEQELFGRGGAVQRIVPGEYGVVFQEHSITRMDYRGPPTIFQIDEVERKRGTPSPGSVTWAGGVVFYFGWDGFYAFDGVRSHSLSDNVCSRWFRANSDSSAYDTMRAAVDRLNRLVMWAFKSTSAAAQNDRLIIYNLASKKWSWAEVDTQILDEFVSSGYTLDDLDSIFPTGIDLESIPVDSDAYQGGGTINLLAFDSSNRGATFSGTAMNATIETREISGPHNERLFTNAARPLIEGLTGAATVSVGHRSQLSDNVTYEIARAPNSVNNEANFRVNDRYLRYRLNLTGNFDHANGVAAQMKALKGRR